MSCVLWQRWLESLDMQRRDWGQLREEAVGTGCEGMSRDGKGGLPQMAALLGQRQVV